MRNTPVALTLAAACLLAACGMSDDSRAGEIAAEADAGGARSFPATGFEKVELRGPDNVSIAVGPAFSVRATGPAKVLEKLVVRVVDGELRVERERDGLWQWDGKGEAQVAVTLPRLTAASIAGSGDMKIDRAEAPSFQASVAGSGNLAIDRLTTDSADITVAGSGNITLAGEAKEVGISVAGSGDVAADKLVAGSLAVSSVGSGDIDAAATGPVTASVMGSGDVTVTGTTDCNVTKMGSGDVKCGA